MLLKSIGWGGCLALLTVKSKVKVKSIGQCDVSIHFRAVLSKDFSLGSQVLAKSEGLLEKLRMLKISFDPKSFSDATHN